ncbi:hypothetical protein GCM10012275_00600 [Longimycelium tulufanense]|uniref:Uncharacterized protein n=1 Tax=Longimycelium tulufanense TaxID=907463 RepID=A0A8J3C760_9PSEU|nr:hypothetical protein GCM10012275_00600 [Longimycelium tulufanense]
MWSGGLSGARRTTRADAGGQVSSWPSTFKIARSGPGARLDLVWYARRDADAVLLASPGPALPR